MIMLKIEGRLGNNMFQYAAVKTLARRKGLKLCYRYRGDQSEDGRLGICFRLDNESIFDRVSSRLIWRLKPQASKRVFSPRREVNDTGLLIESFDPSVYDTEDWTEFRGGFQSQNYFLENREEVLSWFTPKPKYQDILHEIDFRLPVPRLNRCCLH